MTSRSSSRVPRQVRGDGGFTLLEILIVMVIIVILMAIAIPTLVEQRGKAHDAATRQDASRLGKAVVTYFLDHSTAPTVMVTGGRFLVQGEDVGAASSGVVVAGANPAAVDVTGWTASGWCLALTNPQGVTGTERFSAQQGLEPGACHLADGSLTSPEPLVPAAVRGRIRPDGRRGLKPGARGPDTGTVIALTNEGWAELPPVPTEGEPRCSLGSARPRTPRTTASR